MKACVDIAERSDDRSAEIDRTLAPPLAPGEPAVDLAHLSRMTLGEHGLEREVLGLFDRQAEMLLHRMASESPRVVAALAHTLAGSASGIGAWRVAEAAAAVERAAIEPGVIALTSVLDQLAAAIAEAHAAIGELQLADCPRRPANPTCQIAIWRTGAQAVIGGRPAPGRQSDSAR